MSEDGKHINGSTIGKCLLESTEWTEMYETTNRTFDKVRDLNINMVAALKPLECLGQMLTCLKTIETNLIGPATGRDQVPKEVMGDVLDKVTKSYKSAMLVLAGCCGALIFILVFLLTGAHFGWVNILGPK